MTLRKSRRRSEPRRNVTADVRWMDMGASWGRHSYLPYFLGQTGMSAPHRYDLCKNSAELTSVQSTSSNASVRLPTCLTYARQVVSSLELASRPSTFKYSSCTSEGSSLIAASLRASIV